jgi:acyl carrier protein
MTEANILERVRDILRDVLNRPDLTITRESSAATVKGWDSFSHVEIIWNVEQEFAVHFALGELQDLKNVGGLVDLLERKLMVNNRG